MAAPRQLVLIPSYDSGPQLALSVAAALSVWPDVWVVADGSRDGSEALPAQAGLRVIRRARNGGKGAAVLTGLAAAVAAGFTHVLVMDGDGQHPAGDIPAFMAASAALPAAMILGVPVFDASAPWVRVWGRRISNALARWETGCAIGDSLFGFRVYPAAPLLAEMTAGRRMRRYDFDTEAVVRLCWRGVPLVNIPARVRYFTKAQGGVSHFRYGRDNARLAVMHLRLLAEALFRPSRR